ncbi:MAG: amino acid ABC transporter substrate-binding protein [Trueperaceae bacterium]|nr:amino acid ABC transporter substrate-binding protein [Trueperaceae bacterium]
MRKLISLIAVLAIIVSGTALAQATIEQIESRDSVICGVNATGLPGFATVDESGNYAGFDVDFCRAVAAAVLGDASKVTYRGLSAGERFTALQTGEVDVLIRNTTWTSNRDTALGLNFAPTTFYDGQGFLVRGNSGIETLDDLDGTTICVQSGTTTELNLADVMNANGLEYEAIINEQSDPLLAAYDDGACDAYTTDKSGLVAQRTQLRDPSEHVIMDATISKEPLGPSVRHGDDQFFDIVKWVVFATFAAEEYGITSENVDDVMISTQDSNIKRLLGVEPEKVEEFGLSADAFYQVIKQVGNYAEIYNRNLGPDTPFDVPRGLNSSYVDGGLLYSPPVR